MNLYNLFQNTAGDQVNEAYDRPFRGVGGAFYRGDDEHHEIDRAREQRDQSGTWYIRINGKILKTRDGQPYTFRGKAAANKAAVTMAAKPFNAGKEFMLTTNPVDRQQGVAEAPTSAAVRLGRAAQRVQGRTAASQARAIIPSSLPKPEPKPQTPVREDEELHIGDPVIVTGPVEFEGSTGEISDFGSGKRFVVVNLYNHGRHSFHISDISYNDYAGSDEEEARAYDSDRDARNWNMESTVDEHIVKVKGGYELKSKHGNKNLGKYPTRAGAEKRERQVQYFKHATEGVAEGKDDKIAQLKKDYATAVHWSKNDTNPHKREAARQKAEKIKRHLETQYKQGVAEASSPAQQAAIAIAKKKDIEEEKVRLDPKCWTGKHKEGTKIKGGVRVNNCVPNESVDEEQVDELNFFKTTTKQEAPKSKTTTADIRKFFQNDKPSNGVGGRVDNTADPAKAKQVYRRYATEGRVKELSADLKSMTDAEFKTRYKMTKAEARANLKPKATTEDIQLGDGFIIECGDSAIETVVLGHYNDGILIEFDHTATFMLTDNGITLTEAEYHGRTVPLGKRMAGDVKKSKVYVKKPNGKVVKVNFGDKNMTIKKHLPKHRKSYRARHHCENPGPRWKANYWSCRAW